MNITIRIFVYIILISFLLICSCQINTESEIDKMDAMIIAKVDNETPKEQLITKEYRIEYSIVDFLNLTISDFDKQYNIECLRGISDNMYYSVTKDSLGGYLYVLFEREGKNFISTDVIHCEKPVYMSDFKKIILNNSTLDDVRAIDKYGYEMFGTETGRLPFSTHQTIDGYLITITYNSNNEGIFIVSEIQFSQPSDMMYKMLLPIDIIS